MHNSGVPNWGHFGNGDEGYSFWGYTDIPACDRIMHYPFVNKGSIIVE